jgi:hypothetical protein
MPGDHDRRARERDDALVRGWQRERILPATGRNDFRRPECAVSEAQVE